MLGELVNLVVPAALLPVLLWLVMTLPAERSDQHGGHAGPAPRRAPRKRQRHQRRGRG